MLILWSWLSELVIRPFYCSVDSLRVFQQIRVGSVTAYIDQDQSHLAKLSGFVHTYSSVKHWRVVMPRLDPTVSYGQRENEIRNLTVRQIPVSN